MPSPVLKWYKSGTAIDMNVGRVQFGHTISRESLSGSLENPKDHRLRLRRVFGSFEGCTGFQTR